MPSLSQRTIHRVLIAAMMAGFLILVVVGAAATRAFQDNVIFAGWVSHTQRVEKALADYGLLTERLETARRGYFLARRPSFLADYQTTAAQLPPALALVRQLTRDNPSQQANVRALQALSASHLRAAGLSVAVAQVEGDPTAEFSLDQGVQRVREIRTLVNRMEEQEQQLLALREAERHRSVNAFWAWAIAGGLMLALVAGGSTLLLVRFTADINASRDELKRLNEGLEDEVAARTADLQRANDEIQRFAYIVSHDLRSPLVNVMGFTSELEAALKPLSGLLDAAEERAPDLVDPAARAAVREDLPEALGFIRSSTQKMDRLINAILKLSREGRRVLAPERVDTQALFAGISDTLEHRRDELGATLEIEPGLPPVVSDRLALEQIFSNLVENAFKYLKPGRPGQVVVRGRVQHGRAIFEIEDNGRGVDPRDHERIFELFRRAGAQDQPGEGIGLAHVRALAYRLGGTVTVDSALDRGSTFRVSLPLGLPVEGIAA
jgi:signal transduction histidine kinase